ncbi:MAG: MerR family transcriptional regulator [Terriglobia bacterium]
MPDYMLAERLAVKLGLSPEELGSFEARGIIKGIAKNGRTYYSSQDAYRLKAVLQLVRTKGLAVEEARARVVPVVSSPGSAN